MSEHWIHNPTISIIILSLVVNFLVLPMYKQADAMQAEEREKEKALEKWTKHIKETFKGDERFMMLQTYYRQENYKQLYVLKSSIPLLLQVPFFMAAYNFLSHLKYLDGVSLGPIKNLAEPDALITIGAISINFLPILMTTINIIAGDIYSKGFPLKTKIQMNGIAIVFLVLLYNSPAGLVFYWTLNNVFSLVKNIVAKVIPQSNKKLSNIEEVQNTSRSINFTFWFSAIYMALLVGFALPTDTLKGNAQEYINLANYFSPIDILKYTLCTSIGVFVVWVGIFYLLAKRKNKKYYAIALVSIALISTYNVLTIRYLGGLTIDFSISPYPEWAMNDNITNIITSLLILGLVSIIWKHKKEILMYFAITLVLTSVVWGISNYRIIYNDVGHPYYRNDNYCVPGTIKLSKDGNNVVIIMLDRAIGSYYPYILNNNDIVNSSFGDFTYYPNTISYGGNTIFGAPAIYGGPDYSTLNINLASDTKMSDKINQSLLVMPVIFSDNGYDVTFANPTYAGYKWIPDLSIFDDYDVNAYITNGAFANLNEKYKAYSDELVASQLRNLFCYSATKCMPSLLIQSCYDEDYYALEYNGLPKENLIGFDPVYENSYTTLDNMITMSEIVDGSSNNVYIMSNDMTHTTLLHNDNTYKDGLTDISGNKLTFESMMQIATYQTNEKAYETISKWIEYLKENEVYDNTRIIIVSDHGFELYHQETNITEAGRDLMLINPLLIVKDFNSSGIIVDESFMTNAAVPYLATKDIIANPVNPFTGNPISLDYLKSPQYVIDSISIMPSDNPGYKYDDGQWFEVTGDSFEDFVLVPVATP